MVLADTARVNEIEVSYDVESDPTIVEPICESEQVCLAVSNFKFVEEYSANRANGSEGQ